jgi:hypothetical protein
MVDTKLTLHSYTNRGSSETKKRTALMIKLVRRKLRSTESWPASTRFIHARVLIVGVCVETSVASIVPRLHDTDSNEPAIEEKSREEHTADAATTNAASTETPDLPNENEAITTSTADGKQESIITEKDGAEGVQHSANVNQDTAGKAAEEERDAAATNHDEQDDHIVEGEEDTVIY